MIFPRGEEYPKSLEPESLSVKIGVNSIAFPDVNRVVSDRILSALDGVFDQKVGYHPHMLLVYIPVMPPSYPMFSHENP